MRDGQRTMLCVHTCMAMERHLSCGVIRNRQSSTTGGIGKQGDMVLDLMFFGGKNLGPMPRLVRQFTGAAPMCPPGPGGFLRVFLDRPKLFSPLQSFLSTPNHIPTFQPPPDTYHGSRYASSDLHDKGLAEGALAFFPEHRVCGCEVLLLQDPGTAHLFWSLARCPPCRHHPLTA